MSPEQTHVAHMILQCPLLLDSYHSKTITILACSSGSSSTTLHLHLRSTSLWLSSSNNKRRKVRVQRSWQDGGRRDPGWSPRQPLAHR